MRLHFLLVLALLSCKNLLPDKETTPSPNIGPTSNFVLKDPPSSMPAPPALRLSDDAAPIRYRASLNVDPAKKTFTGEIEIDLSIKKPTDIIWLHGTELTIKSASIWRSPRKSALVYETPDKTSGSTYAKVIVPDEKVDKNFIGFSFNKPLEAGNATLYISYKGNVKEGFSGLFVQEENKEKYLYTQFESTGARRVFPCFDEPGFKVPWQLTITAPSRFGVFTNTPQAKEVSNRNSGPFSFLEGDNKTITFAETKPLPSYLIAFAVGPFEVVDGGKIGKNKVPHRVITLKGQGAWAKEAIDSTPAIVAALEDYLGTPYPYEKLDQIALPFFFGAMENPGLITYANSILTADPSKDNTRQKRTFAQVGAHELAHQWFGDLVTLAWWDELWLNESFAEWMSRKIVMQLHPDWPSAESAVSSANSAKQQDQEDDAIAIRQPIKVHKDIGRSFGNVYSKGQAMLFMLERAIGPAAFQKGIQQYIKDNAWKNATSAEILSALSAQVGRDVSKEFNSFTDTPGVPIVSASLTCEKNVAPKLSLKQDRAYTPTAEKKTPQTWRIPVCIHYKALTEEKRECFVLEQATTTQTLTTKACPDWVILNDGASGYYYSGYSKDLLQKLLKDGGKAMTTPERLSLLADIEAQVDAGDLLIGDAMGYISAVMQDPSYYITREGVGALKGYLARIPAELKPNKERFYQSILAPKLKGLTFATPAKETEEQKISRRAILQSFPNTYKDEALTKEASELFTKWLTDRGAIEPELFGTVLTIAAKNGDSALYDTLLTKGKEEKDNNTQRSLLSNLADFADTALRDKTLALILEKDLPLNAARNLLFRISGNENNYDATFAFVSTNYDKLIEKFSPPKTKEFASDIPWLFSSVCDSDKKKKVEELLTPKLEGNDDAKEEMKQMLKGIDYCISFQAKHAENIKTFLLKY